MLNLKFMDKGDELMAIYFFRQLPIIIFLNYNLKYNTFVMPNDFSNQKKNGKIVKDIKQMKKRYEKL